MWLDPQWPDTTAWSQYFGERIGKMKSIFAVLSTLAVSMGGTAALAQSNIQYVVLSAMYSKPLDSDFIGLDNSTGELGMNGGAGFVLAYGLGISNSFALEAELSIRNSKAKSATGEGSDAIAFDPQTKLSTAAFMLNGVFRVGEVASGIRPYFGAGIGISKVRADSFTFSVNVSDVIDTIDGTLDGVAAYQFLGGIEVPLSDAISARVGYRFFATGTQKLGTIEAKTRSHNLELGFVMAF